MWWLRPRVTITVVVHYLIEVKEKSGDTWTLLSGPQVIVGLSNKADPCLTEYIRDDMDRLNRWPCSERMIIPALSRIFGFATPKNGWRSPVPTDEFVKDRRFKIVQVLGL